MNAIVKKCLLAMLGAFSFVLLTQTTAYADTISLDTSSLQGSPSAPFQLAFVLIDASLTGDGNNTAVLSSFAFGGGSAGSVGSSGGGVTGDLISGITLIDSDPSGLNFITSAFTPGSTLSFNLAMTANPDSTLDPSANLTGDQLLFFILDNGGLPIHSTDKSTPDAFAIATVGPNGLTVQQFSVPVETSVPEPGTVLLLGTGLALGLFRRSRRSS